MLTVGGGSTFCLEVQVLYSVLLFFYLAILIAKCVSVTAWCYLSQLLLLPPAIIHQALCVVQCHSHMNVDDNFTFMWSVVGSSISPVCQFPLKHALLVLLGYFVEDISWSVLHCLSTVSQSRHPNPLKIPE